MMDQGGQAIRNLLNANGVDPRAQRAVMEVQQFAQANGLPPDEMNARMQYGSQLADYLRNRGHNVTVNE